MIKKYILLIFMFPLFFFLNCGGYNPNEATGEGSIVFKLELQDTPLVSKPQTEGESQLPRMAPLDCTTTGVSTVEVKLYNSGGNFVANGGPWNCSAHSGTVNNVTAGSNLTLVFFGKDSYGSIVYRGEVNGITVTNGQTTNVGTITAYSFLPTLLSPANNSTTSSRTVTFSWGSVTAASSYNILIMDDKGIASDIRVDTTATSYTTTLFSSGIFSWRVMAKDSYGNYAISSGTQLWKVNVP